MASNSGIQYKTGKTADGKYYIKYRLGGSTMSFRFDTKRQLDLHLETIRGGPLDGSRRR